MEETWWLQVFNANCAKLYIFGRMITLTGGVCVDGIWKMRAEERKRLFEQKEREVSSSSLIKFFKMQKPGQHVPVIYCKNQLCVRAHARVCCNLFMGEASCCPRMPWERPPCISVFSEGATLLSQNATWEPVAPACFQSAASCSLRHSRISDFLPSLSHTHTQNPTKGWATKQNSFIPTTQSLVFVSKFSAVELVSELHTFLSHNHFPYIKRTLNWK